MKRIAKYIISHLLQRIEFTNTYLDILERRVLFLLEKSSASISVSFVLHIEPDKYFPKEDKQGSCKRYFYPYEYKSVDMLPDYLSNIFGDVKCILMITNPIFEERPEIIKNLFKKGHEIGIHTHPQFRPDVDVRSQDNTWLYNFDYKWQYPYIKWHAERLYEIIGEYPVSHVAGNFCFNKDTAKALQKISKDYDILYMIDCSMNGVPNVCKPYKMDINNVLKENNLSNVIEVPVTGDYFSTIGKGCLVNWISYTPFKELKWFFLNTVYRNLKTGNKNIVLIYWGHNFNFFDFCYENPAWLGRLPGRVQMENTRQLNLFLKNFPCTTVVPLKEIFFKNLKHNLTQEGEK